MMYKIDTLTLMTGGDIQLKTPAVKIHQPKVKEIALIGEGKFFQGMNIFYIGSEPLEEFVNNLDTITEGEKNLLIESATAYDNLLFLMQASSLGENKDKFTVIDMTKTVFKLILPDYNFIFNSEKGVMLLMAQDKSDSIVVDRDLFLQLKDIAVQIFLLNQFFDNEEQQDMSEAARKIADKIATAEKKIKQANGESQEDSQFARILSIMGMKNELDYLSNLTVYQLYNQFERFNLMTNYDQSMQASLAGASNVELVDWYKKI